MKDTVKFFKKAPEKISELVVVYVDTFDFVKAMFENAHLEVKEETVLEITKEIVKAYQDEYKG